MDTPKPIVTTNNEGGESIEKDVATLFNKLPYALQKFLTGDGRKNLERELVTKYTLSAEQTEVLGRGLSLMLLGVINPATFRSSLLESAVPEKSLSALFTDIKEQVFDRLKDSEPQKEPAGLSLQTPVIDQQKKTSSSPNTTPLVKEYVADPYREPPE